MNTGQVHCCKSCLCRRSRSCPELEYWTHSHPRHECMRESFNYNNKNIPRSCGRGLHFIKNLSHPCPKMPSIDGMLTLIDLAGSTPPVRKIYDKMLIHASWLRNILLVGTVQWFAIRQFCQIPLTLSPKLRIPNRENQHTSCLTTKNLNKDPYKLTFTLLKFYK